MKRQLITAAAKEPETLAMLRKQLRLDSHEEDDLLVALLRDARNAAEEHAWRKFITQTWDEYFDAFDDPLRLGLSPVQSVASVKYLDSNGVLQTLSTGIYELGEENGVGVVRRKYGQSWPVTRGTADAVVVRYACGYGDDPEDVPEMVRSALRIHVAHHYVNRGGEEPPAAFYNLLAPISARRFL